jgi:dihydrofolate reductase
MSAAVSTPPLVLVAAIARNGAIGRDNRLLWRLKSDMAHFRAVTMGKPVLMGRKTWDSIGRPLPGREIIVVTRDPSFHAKGIHVARDLENGLALAALRAEAMGAGEIVVAGGGQIYAALIDRARRLLITEVDLAPEADAFFPAIDAGLWRETARAHHAPGAGDEAAFDFVEYERV